MEEIDAEIDAARKARRDRRQLRVAMIRVVLDTNILISALLTPQGPPTQVLLMIILQPDTQLCVSGDIYANTKK